MILGPLFAYANILGVENPYKDDFEKCARANVKLECKLSTLHHFLDILVFWGTLKFVKSRRPNLMCLFVREVQKLTPNPHSNVSASKSEMFP